MSTESFPNLKQWWKEDKDKLMTFVYWSQKKIPPTNPRQYEASWQKLKQQLNSQYPAPSSYKTEVKETVMPKGVLQQKIKLDKMTPQELLTYFQQHTKPGKSIEATAREFAWRHGYGKMSSKYWDKFKSLVQTKAVKEAKSKYPHGFEDATYRMLDSLRGDLVNAIDSTDQIRGGMNDLIASKELSWKTHPEASKIYDFCNKVRTDLYKLTQQIDNFAL